MIKQFTQHLGLKFIRKEGGELIYECPWCASQKFSVNATTGAWQCFRGCGEGYPYQLAKKLTALEPKGIFELLERFGLGTDSPTAARTQTEPPKAKHPQIKPEDIIDLTDEDIETFCTAKNISKNALSAFTPKRHKREPLVLLPAYDPDDMEKPCGFIRCGLSGQMVKIKYRDTDGTIKEKEEKYPVVKGSSPGLLGVHRIAQDNPESIIYAEGWKDALAAIQAGFSATCNSQGAKTWRDSWLSIFKDKNVYIIFDRDAAGVNGAKKVAPKILAVAKAVWIVQLPYEYKETNGNDLHDYIVQDKHSPEDLTLLLTQAPAYATPPVLPEQSGKGVVILPDDHPDTIADAFWQHSKQNDVQHKYNRFDGWSIFHKGKYQRVEDIKEIRLHIRKFITNCWIKKGRGEKAYRVRIKQSSGFIGDILEALAAMPQVHLLPKKKAPCSLDNSLDSEHVIAAKNVLIDISQRPHVTHPITEQFYTLNYLTYEYRKGAFPDKWASFLADITLSDIDLMLLLQQWCGYLLLPTLKYQKFLLCVGDGANGKGVFFDTITAALSQANTSNVPLARFDNPYALFGTYGKLVNMSNENARNIENKAESIIKEYVAGDKVLWEQKYHDAFFAYPTAKLMFATNELPRIKDATDGIWRRMILVPFEAKFTGDKQNTNLSKELQQPDELAGILNWMIEGAEILEKMGRFTEPKKCKTALENYRDESDSARLFLRDNFEHDPENDTPIPCTWLHQQYQNWCNQNGFKAKNNVHFGHSVNQLFTVSKSRPYFGTRKINVYVGLKFQEGSEIEQELEKWTS